MRVKKVNRYYCDFCKKANCSGGAIAKHERGCTNNPNRTCGMHKYCENPQLPIAELKAPLIASLKDRNWKAAMDSLRVLASGCPACMLAALRQSELGALPYDPETDLNPPDLSFDFTKEVAEFWSAVSDAAYESEKHAIY